VNRVKEQGHSRNYFAGTQNTTSPAAYAYVSHLTKIFSKKNHVFNPDPVALLARPDHRPAHSWIQNRVGAWGLGGGRGRVGHPPVPRRPVPTTSVAAGRGVALVWSQLSSGPQRAGGRSVGSRKRPSTVAVASWSLARGAPPPPDARTPPRQWVSFTRAVLALLRRRRRQSDTTATAIGCCSQIHQSSKKVKKIRLVRAGTNIKSERGIRKRKKLLVTPD
jgi:hypothetical protein